MDVYAHVIPDALCTLWILLCFSLLGTDMDARSKLLRYWTANMLQLQVRIAHFDWVALK
jgi:hypothetical protein